MDTGGATERPLDTAGGVPVFRMLGRLEVVEGARDLTPQRHKPRALLGALLLRAGRTVSVDVLIDDLWGARPPASARNLVHGYVSEVRRALDDGRARTLRTVDGGYLLDVPSDRVDARRFEELVATARVQLDGAPRRAADRLREALDLWRGPVLADLADEQFVRPEARRLEGLRRTATELRLEADLACGQGRELVPELEALVAAEPLRESLWAKLALAQYRAGRQADALETLAAARRVLREELAVDPGPELRKLQRRILEQDPALRPRRAGEPRGNLPTAATPLVGREEELERLGARVRNRPLVTLTGPGGVGKTRLALELGRRLGDTFPDGVWFVDLAPATGSDGVAERLVRALGLRDDSDGGPLEEVVRYLGTRRALVVLDNCERVAETAAELVHVLTARAPHVRVLATSRVPLRAPGESIVPVAGLATPSPDAGSAEVARSESARLFEQHAARLRPDFCIDEGNAAAVGTLCRRLDGLPLALELAAARTRVLSPAQIAERLPDRFSLLTGGLRTAPARHQTLHAAVTWSYELLSSEERLLFEALSVFPGAFCLDAVEALAGHLSGLSGTGAEVVDLLATLVEASLVTRGADGVCGPRFRLLETLRAFAAERLEQRWRGGQHRLRPAHARFVAALTEEARLPVTCPDPDPDTGRSLDRLDEHRDDLEAALRWCLGPGDHALGLRVLHASWWLWFVRGPLEEIDEWLRRALDEHGAGDDVQWRGLMLARGWISASRGDLGTAAAYADRLAEVGRDQDDPYHEAAAVALAATVSWARGDHRGAEAGFRDSLVRFEATGHRWFALGERLLLARVLADQDRHDESRVLLDEALTSARRLGEPFLLGLALDLDARLARARDERERAQRSCEEALTPLRAVGYLEGLGSVLTRLGRLALEDGDAARAGEVLGEALVLARRLGHPGTAASCLESLAALEAARHRPQEAAELLGAADALRDRIDAPRRPADHAFRQNVLGLLTESLDEETLERARRRGAARAPGEG